MFNRIAAALLLAPGCAIAGAPPDAEHYLAQELADCGAYYLLLADLPGMRGETDVDSSAADQGALAVRTAALYESPEAVMARYRLALLNIKSGLDSAWDNVHVFRARFKDSCPAAVAAPEERLGYWQQHAQRQALPISSNQ